MLDRFKADNENPIDGPYRALAGLVKDDPEAWRPLLAMEIPEVGDSSRRFYSPVLRMVHLGHHLKLSEQEQRIERSTAFSEAQQVLISSLARQALEASHSASPAPSSTAKPA